MFWKPKDVRKEPHHNIPEWNSCYFCTTITSCQSYPVWLSQSRETEAWTEGSVRRKEQLTQEEPAMEWHLAALAFPRTSRGLCRLTYLCPMFWSVSLLHLPSPAWIPFALYAVIKHYLFVHFVPLASLSLLLSPSVTMKFTSIKKMSSYHSLSQ